MYKFEKTKSFEKNLKKLSSKEQKSVADKLKIMAENVTIQREVDKREKR